MSSSEKNTAWKIAKITDGMKELLLEKNKRYGDAALNPSNVFSKEDAANSIMVRIDDKINRIKNSKELRKNDVSDLMGYLVLLMASKDWITFKDLID